MDKKLRVWWIPQIPGKPFTVPVHSVEEGHLLLETLAAYDMFQYENRIKPDYSNAGGLQIWEDDGDGGFDWCDWYDEESGDDFDEWRANNLPQLFAEILTASGIAHTQVI